MYEFSVPEMYELSVREVVFGVGVAAVTFSVLLGLRPARGSRSTTAPAAAGCGWIAATDQRHAEPLSWPTDLIENENPGAG